MYAVKINYLQKASLFKKKKQNKTTNFTTYYNASLMN